MDDSPVDPCYYCGVPATSIDHVIPQTLRGRIPDWEDITVPACHECNSRLGDRVFNTLPARKRYIKERLGTKHAKLLRMPDWTEEELAEIGPTLQRHIRAGIAAKFLILARLAW